MAKQSKIKTVIVDGSEQYRNSLSEHLTSEEITFIGLVNNGKELFKLLETKKPDIIIYDLYDSPISLTCESVKKLSPKSKLVFLSFYDDELLIEDCIEKGAKGFIYKSIYNLEVFADLIKRIHNGETVVYTGKDLKQAI